MLQIATTQRYHGGRHPPVFSGMLGVTPFGIFLTPVFHYVIVRLTSRRDSLAVQPHAA